MLGRRGLGFQIRLLGFGLGIWRVLGLELGGRGIALLGLALDEFPVLGIVLCLEIEVCLGSDVGLGLVLELGMGFRFVMG